MIDEKGRCCGRKPLLYKRPTLHLFCPRCYRTYDPRTRRQVENWAWILDADNKFVRNPKYMKKGD